MVSRRVGWGRCGISSRLCGTSSSNGLVRMSEREWAKEMVLDRDGTDHRPVCPISRQEAVSCASRKSRGCDWFPAPDCVQSSSVFLSLSRIDDDTYVMKLVDLRSKLPCQSSFTPTSIDTQIPCASAPHSPDPPQTSPSPPSPR